MTTKVFIVKHVKGAEVPRLIEAPTLRRVESLVLEDYDIAAVKSTNAGEMGRLMAEGVKVERAPE